MDSQKNQNVENLFKEQENLLAFIKSFDYQQQQPQNQQLSDDDLILKALELSQVQTSNDKNQFAPQVEIDINEDQKQLKSEKNSNFQNQQQIQQIKHQIGQSEQKNQQNTFENLIDLEVEPEFNSQFQVRHQNQDVMTFGEELPADSVFLDKYNQKSIERQKRNEFLKKQEGLEEQYHKQKYSSHSPKNQAPIQKQMIQNQTVQPVNEPIKKPPNLPNSVQQPEEFDEDNYFICPNCNNLVIYAQLDDHFMVCENNVLKIECKFCKEEINEAFMNMHLQECDLHLIGQFQQLPVQTNQCTCCGYQVDVATLLDHQKICQNQQKNQLDGPQTKNVEVQEQLDCSICSLGMFDADPLKFLECDHFFHEHCIEGWLKMTTSCPMCRREVKT